MNASLSSLNTRQLEAVMCQEACALLAGPGTGKTATLLAKLEQLLQRTTDSHSILVLTYTHAAAGELQQRLNHIGGSEILRSKQTRMGIPSQKDLFVGTIHSWCVRFLRQISCTFDFTIATERDQEEILKQLGVSARSFRKTLLGISAYKQGIVQMEDSEKIAKQYTEHLRERGLFDFDDLLLEAYRQLQNSLNLPLYTHILVDEFQDFNQLQYNILRHLLRLQKTPFLETSRQPCIFVVGDPKQAIYGFRGGSAKFFDELRTDFQDQIETIELDTSYRCDQKILDVAGAFWAQNKKLQSYACNSMQDFSGVFHIQTENQETEAYWIVSKIKDLAGIVDHERTTVSNYIRNPVTDFSRVCISYRNYQSVIGLAKILDDSSLPYVLYKEKDFLRHEDVRIFLVILNSILYNDWLEVPSEFMFVRNRLAKVSNQSLREVVGIIVKALEEKFPDSPYLLRLMRIAWQYTGVWETDAPLYLAELHLLDHEDQVELLGGKISVMSLHATKGLEFDVMFIVGVEEGLIPSSLAVSDEEIEEEKRLLYVGITRARHQVYLTSVNSRVIFGKREARSVSRFLKPLVERKLLEVEKDELGEQFMKKKKEKRRQMRMW